MAFHPEWPKSLTNADWQKKKGNIAKLAGETGLGDAMTDAEKEFNKIDWQKMDASGVLPKDRNIPTIKQRQQDTIPYYRSTIEPVRTKVKKIKDLAEKTAADWKKNKLIPSSSRKAAEDVANAADMLWMELKGNSSSMEGLYKSFDKLIEEKQHHIREAVKVFGSVVSSLEDCLKKFASAPKMTKALWEQGKEGDYTISPAPHQACRSICNGVRRIPELNEVFWDTWKPFGDFYHKDAPDGEGEAKAMKAKGQTVWQALQTLKKDYPKILQAG